MNLSKHNKKNNLKISLQKKNFAKVSLSLNYHFWKDIGKENLLDCLSENLSIELKEINDKKTKIIY